MSDIDLSAARQAAFDMIRTAHGRRSYATQADMVLDAVAPLIEAAVREQIARDIEATKRDYQGAPYRSAVEAAARIARGES